MKQIITKFFSRVALVACVATVASPVFAQTTYKLQQVTSVSAGAKYVFEQDGHVMNNVVSSSALQTTDTYKTTGLSGTESYVWTLETATTGFYLKNVSLNSNQYLNNASKTNLSFGNASSIWTFSFDNGVATIQNTSNSDRFLGYTTSNSYVYKAYATQNLSDYPHEIAVYQLVEESGGTTTYTVTYDANGGSGTMTDSSSPYASGATVTVLSNSFTRDGYSFSKWNTAANGQGTNYNPGATFSISANMTLYAQWTSNAAETTTTIDDSGITNTDVYVSTDAGSLSASVTSGGNPVGGASVTWSGNNNAVATINASTGAVTLVAAGTVTFTATYAGQTGTYQASSDEYEMTVTSSAPYEQPTKFDINLNNNLFGTDYSGSVSGITDSNPIQGSQDNVNVTYAGSGNHYCNNSQIRFYPNNKLTFEAPSGYEIKQIVFTADGTWTATISANSGTYLSDTKTWTGSATSILFTGSGSGRCDMSKATITLGEPASDPVLNAEDLNIAYNATAGNIDFTVTNPVDGGVVSASTEAEWLTIGSAVSASPISFTCTANEGVARTATVTLTYTYNTNQTVTDEVTVTQAAAPVIYTTISDLFNAATSTATSVNITFDSWVVSAVKNSNAYITDNAGHGLIVYASGHGFQVNDVLTGTVTCKLQLYRGSAELTDLTSTTTGLTVTSNGTVTPQTIAISTLGGVNTGALLSFEGLTYNGSALADDNSNTITPYTTLYDFGEAFEAGKSYDVSGIYLQYNSTKELLPRNADDIAESVTPSIVLAPSTKNHTAEEVDGGSISITYNNITISAASDFTIKYYDSNEDELAEEPEWITSAVEVSSGDYVINYLLAANEGDARTAYIKVLADGVYSNLATINQAAPVIDYATLPFEFNDGKDAITSVNGLSQSGLGSDYGTANTKLKFDTAGDYLKLKINSAVPGNYTLAFQTQNNGFSGGTFKVCVSADDLTYTDLKVYNSIQNGIQKFDNIPSDVRYIMWEYTSKSSGNIGLGNIKLSQPEETAEKTVTASLNDGKYWATFYCSGAAYELPAGAKAYTLTSSKQLYLLGDGSVVPANTAVIIISDTANLTLSKTDDEAVEISGAGNILRGSSYGMDLTRISGTPYVLGIKANVLSFYKFAGTTVPANKAYYIVNE